MRYEKVGFFRPFLYAILLVNIACSNHLNQKENSQRFDYFQSKSKIKYAKGFSVEYFKSYKIVDVVDESEANTVLNRYILVEQGTQIPAHNKNDIVLRVPLTSVSCLSTTHIPYLAAINLTDRISGIGHPELVLDSTILDQIVKGWTMGITTSGQVDLEKILESNTSVLMAYPFDRTSLEGLEKFDIPVVYVAEYLENSALARAEWIKFFALFFNKEKIADHYFSNIEQNYLLAKTRIDAAANINRPTVFFGSFYQDVWFAPGGKSLISGLLHDAGGDYLFSDNNSIKNITLANEVILSKISEISYWSQVISSQDLPEKENFMAGDKRFLQAADNASIKFFYVNTKQSDYFGRANLEPDVLLKDIGNIFYPDLFPNHQFVYFHSLKRED